MAIKLLGNLQEMNPIGSIRSLVEQHYGKNPQRCFNGLPEVDLSETETDAMLAVMDLTLLTIVVLFSIEPVLSRSTVWVRAKARPRGRRSDNSISPPEA